MTDLPLFPETVETLLAYAVLSKPPADPAAFRRLVGLTGRLGPLTASCFLLYRPAEKQKGKWERSKLPGHSSVRRFVLHTAPVLLGQLNRTTQARRVTMYGHTRGKVDWSATYKRRYSEDSNPTVFVCLQSWRRFDRPENQLFVYLLKAVRDSIQRVPRWLWDWQAWGAALQSEEAGTQPREAENGVADAQASTFLLENRPFEIGDYFAQLAHRLRLLRGHIALQEIPVPETVSARHILAALSSKNELYSELVDFYHLYQAVVGYPEWESWRRVLVETLPMPESATEIGEYLRQD